jgi:mono/diheme cytochrome c family protein
VANNCAVCHTTSYRVRPMPTRCSSSTGPNHTTNVEAFFRYLIDCAKDPRFNADILMAEINRVTELDLIDKLLYRFLIIPITKKRLLEREAAVRLDLPPGFPALGPRPRRRDEPDQVLHDPLRRWTTVLAPPTCPRCGTSASTAADQGMRMNYAGDSHDAYSVIMDSALGLLGAPPKDSKEEFVGEVRWLHRLPVGGAAAAEVSVRDRRRQGRARQAGVRADCAGCHASELTGTAAAAGRRRHQTGPPRFLERARRAQGQRRSSRRWASSGRPGRGSLQRVMSFAFLDGIWLRAPYLHNGSVPTLRDLLEPAAQRPTVFWRGYDLYDQTGSASSATPRRRSASAPGSTRQQGRRQPGTRVRQPVIGGREGGTGGVSEDAVIGRRGAGSARRAVAADEVSGVPAAAR